MLEYYINQVYEIAQGMSSDEYIYIYSGCQGGIYTSNEPLEIDSLYCESCGDRHEEILSGCRAEILEACVECLLKMNDKLEDEVLEIMDLNFELSKKKEI